jgi:RimJ/RimL family protein N-acetyltransferase
MSRLRLDRMSEADVRAFVPAQTEEYARGIEEHGGWSREDALAKAERDMAQSFPGGRAPAGNHLFHLVEKATGERVGVLWYREDTRGVWLYQILVEESRRGQGLGREAMALLEEEARRLGAPRIELNVFGGNEPARALYRKLGYREDAVVMSKPLEG